MSPADDRVLILAPTGQDAHLICDQLRVAGIEGVPCPSLEELADAVSHGAATALIAEEALERAGLQRLLESLGAQPAWSDLPLTVLTGAEAFEPGPRSDLLRCLAERGNVTLLERPLRIVTLLMTIQAAVRARRRQYEFRDYLHRYEKYQEQVRQTQKLESLGVLAGGIAHDFNNILTGVLGNASLATEILPDGHPAKALLEDVVTASERAAALTSQMLAYAGKGRFVVQQVDLSDVVRKMSDFFRASIPKTVELRLGLASGLPPVEADITQIEQVLMNLVINAAEAIPEGMPGKVAVTTGLLRSEAGGRPDSLREPSGRDYLVLEVSDNGAGMDDGTLSKIFDPFFTTKFMGRGLGLAAVQGIVRGHHGDLTVRSKPGEGTIFSIFLPVSGSPPSAPEETAGSGSDFGRATVLVVDDEEVVRRTATALLEQHGFSVLTADNGKDAVDLMETLGDAIDVVLLDVTMPVMDGEQTLRQLKVIRPDAKILLSSGYDESEALRRFSSGGLAGFIQKPYTSARLAEKISHTLNGSGHSRN